MIDAPLSLNARAGAVADALAREARLFGVGVSRGPGGATILDCGLGHPGSTGAGLRLARIAMGDLGEVELQPAASGPLPWRVAVRTAHLALACLGSQYAGWRIEAASGTVVMGSGPARLLARQEAILEALPHREEADRAVLLLEGQVAPDAELAGTVADACRLPQSRLTLLHAPTGSVAGLTQIAARVIECAVQKAQVHGVPLGRLREALGWAPLAPPHPDMAVAMGRANDSIIYGGHVHLLVEGPAAEARDLAQALPSRTSPHWGQGFGEVYRAAGGDFAEIDAGFFSPAEVIVTALETGESFSAGHRDHRRLASLVQAV